MPRTIQTIVLIRAFSGIRRLIEPNAIISPKGKAPRSVTANISSVFKKPPQSVGITVCNINI